MLLLYAYSNRISFIYSLRNFEGKLYTTFTLPNFQPEDYQIVGLIEESFVYEQIIHNKENIQ
jgi:hypothetical protein